MPNRTPDSRIRTIFILYVFCWQSSDANLLIARFFFSTKKLNDNSHESTIPSYHVAPFDMPAGLGTSMPVQRPSRQAPQQQSLTLPRAPLEIVAELWAQQVAPPALAGPSTLTSDPMASYLSLDYPVQPSLPSVPRDADPSIPPDSLLPAHDHVRFLAGLPSPPLSSTGVGAASTLRL